MPRQPGATEVQLSFAQHITNWADDDNGSTTTGMTAASGRPFDFEYDANGNLTLIRVGGPDGLCQENRMTYDSAHRITSFTRSHEPGHRRGHDHPVRLPVHHPDGGCRRQHRPVQAVSVVPHTTYTISADKRVTAVTDPAGSAGSTAVA